MTESSQITDSAPRSTPLTVSKDDEKLIDEAILQMVKMSRRRSISIPVLRSALVLADSDLCHRIDELLAEAMISLKRLVEDAGEKLYERMDKVIDEWEDVDEQRALGIIFFRFMDTMRYMTAFKGKFRGYPRKYNISKDQALVELESRGLGKR